MIYLDHASTSPVLPEVREEIFSAMDRVTGNPSNLHKAGQEAARLLRSSRARVAACLGVLPTEIFFCSCGTEANNWILESAATVLKDLDLLALSTIEHASVHFKAESLAGRIRETRFCTVDDTGVLKMDGLPDLFQGKKVFFSLLAVNNETGVIQPLEELRSLGKEGDLILHSDATQALGKISFLPAELDLDFATFSGHKIGAPKGIGFLYKKQQVAFSKLLHGGNQEFGYRGGTENIPYIAGLAKAVELATVRVGETNRHLTKLYAAAVGEIAKVGGIRLNGSQTKHSRAIINFSVEGLPSDILQIRLSDDGLCLSGGSACSSGANRPSRVLTAMGLDPETIRCALRMSFSPQTSLEEVMQGVALLKKTVASLRTNP